VGNLIRGPLGRAGRHCAYNRDPKIAENAAAKLAKLAESEQKLQTELQTEPTLHPGRARKAK
jgi:hypothetical protein